MIMHGWNYKPRLALLVLLAGSMPVAAQQTNSPGNPPANGGNYVVINQKQPGSIWDLLGTDHIHENMQNMAEVVHSTGAFKFAERTIVGPVLQMTGLLPGSAPESFGPPEQGSNTQSESAGGQSNPQTASGATPPAAAPVATASFQAYGADGPFLFVADQSGGAALAPKPKDLAKKLAKQKEQVAVKVKAIKYLSQQDCVCYPEVVDSLLASLDDCSEEVRYEALRALRKTCDGSNCPVCGAHRSSNRAVGLPTCQCQSKVISRVSDLLLDRDVSGRLKERSERIRWLARLMIYECLRVTPVSPAGSADGGDGGGRARPDPPLPGPQ